MIGTSAQIIAEHKRRLLEVARLGIETTSKEVVGRWAVDTGSSANSWTPNIGSFRTVNVDTTGGDISPVLGRIESVARRVDAGDTYTFGNSKPYARRLEYGWSQRLMPRGALRIALAGHQRATDAAVRQVRR